MIVGNGLIAKSFNKTEKNSLIFASGVSSSSELDNYQFQKEINLLNKVLKDYPNKKLIYFSTVMSNFEDSLYCKHKRFLENYIFENVKNFLIFRLPQVVGNGGNKTNLFNYIINTSSKNLDINVYKNIKRSFIDVRDVSKIVSYCDKFEINKIINIVGIEELDIVDIVKIILEKVRSKSKINMIENHNKKNHNLENCNIVDLAIKNCNIFRDEYTSTLLDKYI